MKVNTNTNKPEFFPANEVITYLEDFNVKKHQKLVNEIYNQHDMNTQHKKNLLQDYEMLEQQFRFQEHNDNILRIYGKKDGTEAMYRKFNIY
jgi:hypothetical protein